ncbi:SET domain-containing protein [Trichostrongylus colubriformis]|uniref:SET domain-containing protein n=1 Tax=Trichostrongylus colubriformis TaxID=6319 RepID=A0AAN8FQP7_TRICO
MSMSSEEDVNLLVTKREESPSSCHVDSNGREVSSSVSGFSRSSSNTEFTDMTRFVHSNGSVPSAFRPGDLEPDEVEVPLHSDVHFIQLPRRITNALVRYRRIVVSSSGDIRPLPYEPNEPVQSDDSNTEGVDPVQRRILHALEQERARKSNQEDPILYSHIKTCENKENAMNSELEKADSTLSDRLAFLHCSSMGVEEDVEEEVEEIDMDLYAALGFTPAQIDRLKNAPLWAPLPKKALPDESAEVEEEECDLEGSSEECGKKQQGDPSERSWEVAVILRPHMVKYQDGSKEKEYVVIWKDWPWNDCWSLAPDCFNDGDKKLTAADTRERLISQMAARMQQKDPQGFQQAFPNFHRRHDYTSWHRVHLRMIEQAINDELEGLEIAPIYFENWTDDERATIDVKYLTRCAMSISNYREAKAVGVALRLQYPEDGAGCDCKGGQCTPFCPCVKRGRKVPLVVMYTTTKGWSVFAPQIIPAGTFLGTYTGEIIPLCSAIAQGVSTSYQFTNIHQIPGTKQYVVDASRMGNETRYFNHACGDAANLKAVSLLSRGNLLTNNMLFFTKRMISKGEELTFSYRGKDAEEQKNGIRCLCTPGCQSRL